MGLVSCSGARHAIEFPISLEGNLAGPCRAGPRLTPQTSQSSENGQDRVGFRPLLFCLLLTETCKWIKEKELAFLAGWHHIYLPKHHIYNIALAIT